MGFTKEPLNQPEQGDIMQHFNIEEVIHLIDEQDFQGMYAIYFSLELD